jgi:HD-GYP domain-containing protein (c-di-GMP phosphodiesterase class II)
MTSDRPYRRGLPVPRALDELRLHAGSQFDRDAVGALLALHGEGELRLAAEEPRVILVEEP